MVLCFLRLYNAFIYDRQSSWAPKSAALGAGTPTSMYKKQVENGIVVPFGHRLLSRVYVSPLASNVSSILQIICSHFSFHTFFVFFSPLFSHLLENIYFLSIYFIN